ncbi:MAG TPA: fibronectin type III domain-containing protein [Solirubrobacter sp.]|nr:fibronectin type III domain-containing protein [Solirubrobacter sp.]
MRRISVVLVVFTWLALGAVSARASTIPVTRVDDPVGVGNCPNDCSLRQAIAASQAGDTVALGVGVHLLTQGRMLVVSHSLTLTGAGPGLSLIDGGQNVDATFQADRILKITAGPVAISGLTFRAGRDGRDESFTSCSPCSTINANGGGALFNQGAAVTLAHVVFDGNAGSPVGGAVATSGGSLTLTDVDFNGNGAAFGAGLFIRSANVTGERVTLRDGEGTARGGGAYLYGGTLALTNATVTGNGWASTIGGGIVNRAGTLTLTSVTLAGNLRGGLETDSGATTIAQNTIFGPAGYGTACVAANRSDIANPVTKDAGNNLVADTSCGGVAGAPVDPLVGPTGFNGGETPTAALLHGSPAIDAGADAACPATDQRGEPRHGTCDIGAFEAHPLGVPTVTTLPASGVSATEATLEGALDLAGEAGVARFEWGVAPDALTNTIEVPAGVMSSPTPRSVVADHLSPSTTYSYRAVALNASGTATGDVVSFTTAPGPPLVSGPTVDGVTDTSADVHFTLDPQGNATSYRIRYSSAAGDLYTASVKVGLDAQDVTRTLTGLTPGTAYAVEVLATSAGGDAEGDTAQFTTDRRVTGTSGTAVQVAETASYWRCPDAATIDWGDGSAADTSAVLRCADDGRDGFDITVTGAHVYAAAGRYHVQISSDWGSGSVWAQIAAAGTPTPEPTATATPAATAAPTVVPTATATPTPVPTPEFHKTVVVAPVSGTVLVKRKGAKAFVALTAAGGIPVGSEVDLTKGKIKLTSVPKRGGAPESATFNGAIVRITQQGASTVLTLTGPGLACGRRTWSPKSAAAAAKKVKKRRLWGEGKGRFQTKGQYSAATVRGTRWYVEDTCTSTTTAVFQGSVSVRDNVKRRTVILRKGKRYTARRR